MQKRKINAAFKILIINQRLATDIGGAENFDIEIARQFVSRGHRVDFLSQAGDNINTKRFSFANKIMLVKVPSLRKYYSIRPGGFLLFYLDRFLFQLMCFFRVWGSGARYDVIQISGWPALAHFIECLLGKKAILRIQGKPDWMQMMFIKRCKNVVANGDVAEYLQSNRIKVKIITPGIDPSFFKVEPHASKNRFCFIYSGRLAPVKNIPLLINAFSRLGSDTKCRLLIVGDGLERERIEKQVISLGLRKKIVFAGHVDRSTLQKYLSRSSVFVISSDYDNYPNAVLEAMASSLPVIATNVGGIAKQIVNNKGGVLVARGDVGGFATAMKKLLNNRSLVKKMGRFNRKSVESEFKWEKSADLLERLYRKQ